MSEWFSRSRDAPPCRDTARVDGRRGRARGAAGAARRAATGLPRRRGRRDAGSAVGTGGRARSRSDSFASGGRLTPTTALINDDEEQFEEDYEQSDFDDESGSDDAYGQGGLAFGGGGAGVGDWGKGQREAEKAIATIAAKRRSGPWSRDL